MTTAGEVFIMQLARAARSANRFLRSRSLQEADRDDITAAALLWCWTNRENYSLTTTIEKWFLGAVRHAYRDWARGIAKHSADVLSEIPSGDDTLAAAQARSSAVALMRALPREYRRVAILQMRGLSRSEMKEQGLSEWTIRDARERIKQLRRLVPDSLEYQQVLRTVPPLSADETPVASHPRIDVEIERMQSGMSGGCLIPMDVERAIRFHELHMSRSLYLERRVYGDLSQHMYKFQEK